MIDISKVKRVQVEWVDRSVSRGDWQGDEGFALWCAEPLPLVQTMGYLLYEDDQQVVVAQSVQAGQACDAVKIPRVCVREIFQLRRG